VSPGGAVALVFAVAVLVVGLGLVAGGVAIWRHTARIPRERVPVEAFCVDRTFMSQPARVTLDYPVPGGWRRATLIEGLPTTSVTGGPARPGDRVVVWVDPHRPQDVRLSPAAGAGGIGGLALLVMGLFVCGFALMLVTSGIR